MKPPIASSSGGVTWLGVAVASIGLATGHWITTRNAAAECLSIPCGYTENGTRYRGVCGSRQADSTNCYCFKVMAEPPEGRVKASEGWPSHRQDACKP